MSRKVPGRPRRLWKRKEGMHLFHQVGGSGDYGSTETKEGEQGMTKRIAVS